MPWMIQKKGNKWGVYKEVNGKPNGEPLGMHDSEGEAQKQLKALYASENKALDTIISIGSTIKALGDGRIGGHLVLWGSPDQKDFYGDYFTPETYLGPGDADGRDATVNHRIAFRTGDPAVDGELKAFAARLIKSPLKTKRDALGVFAETVCDMADAYEATVYKMVEAGKLKWSAGAAPHMVERDEDGRLKMFVISEGALTPIPAEPRMLNHRVLPLRAFVDLLNPPEGDSGGKGDAQQGGLAGRKPTGTKSNEVKTMGLLEAIKLLVPKISDEQAKAIAAILGLAGVDAGSVAAAADAGGGDVTGGGDATAKSFDMVKLAKDLKSLGYPVVLPGLEPAPAGGDKKAATRPPYAFKPEGDGDDDGDPEAAKAQKSIDAAYVLRYGDEDASKKAILTDLIGADYRQKIYEQNIAYAKYLRGGDRELSRAEYKSLKSMYFPIDQVTRFVKDGMAVSEIKATQVEAVGELGGFAVPPNMQAEISTRLPGMTAVRGAGARVVTLASGNSIEILQYRGSDNRYVGLIRGAWGTETQDPDEKNWKLDLIPIIANVYTYKISYSQSIVDDAGNLVSLVNKDMTDVSAQDEDEVFLIGDGVGKPLGILPGGANVFTLTEVHSQSANAVTAAGIKALKRGIPSQYRKNAVWVANSDTYGAIEASNNAGVFYFPDLSEDEKLLARRTFESEVMADIAGSALPILFGDMNGYTIVERLGMSIERFHDSGTGINKVEYQLRRRIGGRIEKPWMFAVQEIAA